MSNSSVMETLSSELASIAEGPGGAVVGVHAGGRMPASGIEWREGTVVTADDAIRREAETKVIGAERKTVSPALSRRDSSTDLAVLHSGETGNAMANVD